MSKSKSNFNTFLKECEEYESIGTNGNGNHRERHHHQHQHSTSTTNNGNGSNIFLNSNSNSNSNNPNAAVIIDSSKLVLNDDNFPSLSSASSVSSSKPKLKPEIQNNKINFKNALSSSSSLLLQQQHQQQQQQQKRLAAIAASNVSRALVVKKESEYIANKIISSKNLLFQIKKVNPTMTMTTIMMMTMMMM